MELEDAHFTTEQTRVQLQIKSTCFHYQCSDSLVVLEGPDSATDFVSVYRENNDNARIILYRQQYLAQEVEELSRCDIFWMEDGGVLSLSANSDGRLLATGSDNNPDLLQFFQRDIQSGKLTPCQCLILRGISMCNCVRFGKIRGTEYLIVSGQSGYLYVFTIPEFPSQETQLSQIHSIQQVNFSSYISSQALACTDLMPPADYQSQNSRLDSCSFVYGETRDILYEPHKSHTAAVYIQTEVGGNRFVGFNTKVIGKFPKALNFAEISPDGKWIVVGCDQLEIYVLSEANGFVLEGCSLISFCDYEEERREFNTQQSGCQYCAWNQDSTLLAASSDYLNCVCVWSIPQGEKLVTMCYHEQPCLALKFVSKSLLAYVEHQERCHLLELSSTKCLDQVLRLPEGNVSGLGVNREQQVTISLDNSNAVQWNLITEWNVLLHKRFPQNFQAAVKALLLAHHKLTNCNQGRHLGFVTKPILLKIIEFAALPLADWLPDICDTFQA
eukprot:TRINITY_DN11021_c0_g4_i1.p1 TRINITY_DN11021_c0_g4~~TRINITY_DN11021_c0_g4_i1.p1  ORF type:complete len:500 (-),score=25.78 TRINITY_DN11021_c0_g4_i1:865-2364(-)